MALAPTSSPDIPAGRVVVSVGRAEFVAEVADDVNERVQGLSGRASMPNSEAMWFVHSAEHIPVFWMREMQFPLDFVWVDGSLTVADITENAPVPEPGMTLDDLPGYSPRVPVQYVLEINAGLAERLGITVGTRVMVRDP